MQPLIPEPSFKRPIPPLARVTQRLATDQVKNARQEVKDRLLGAGLAQKVRPGARIAVTAGSRGTGGLVDLLAGISDAVRQCGGEPFVVPAMGSHGGAVAEGQERILQMLGVSQQAGCPPIRATMDTVELGRSASGASAHCDRYAAEADGILVLGRVKTHPESFGELASGLLKMITIGLGKQIGAQEAHSHGLWPSVREVPRLVLERMPILFGIPVVENAYRQPVRIEAIPPTHDAFLEADMRLLKLAKEHWARIPFEELDVLILDEMGKTVSGAGMDPHVTGLWRVKEAPRTPDYKRIVALRLTEPSLGNALGIGQADFTTRQLVDSIDHHNTYVNLLTATEPESENTREGAIPPALPTDREAIEMALFSSLAGPQPRLCRAKSTARLETLFVSEALLDEVKSNSGLSIQSELQPMQFDLEGQLI